MPLEAPRLDSRTFDQLVEEARRRIPLYAPEWTDFNESDPGATLVDLFAWLTETMLYQMNRLPELNYVKFLQMLNLEQRPAQSATVHLTFSAQAGAAPATVPKGTQVSGPEGPDGLPLIFETEEPLDVVRVALRQVQVFGGAGFEVVTEANTQAGQTFAPFGWVPQVGSALYLGFEVPDPTYQPVFPSEVRLRVLKPLPPEPGTAVNASQVGEAARLPKPPVSLVWEYRPPSREDRTQPGPWRRLDTIRDESLAFTREGYMAFEGPGDPMPSREGKVSDNLYWLRCRITGGAYDANRAPVLDFVLPNTVPAINLSTVRDESLGVSDGSPDQVYALENRPVRDLTLEVQDADGELKTWQRVDDFLASGKDDTHYLLNNTRGEVRFGDGAHGRIPVAGSEIVARSYRYGGGKAGNAARDAVSSLLIQVEGIEGVTNHRAGVGGSDEQTLGELQQYAPQALRNKGRAISGEDFRALAMEVGGVLKAKSVPLMHPDHPGIDVPGAITVVVVPDIGGPRPEPSPDLLERVADYLNQRRLLTTEVYVKGPAYRPVRIVARIAARPYASLDDVRTKALKALAERLDPSKRDFGADLHPSEIYDIILGVEGVQAVVSMQVFDGDRELEGLDDRIVVPVDGLVYDSGDHEIAAVRSEDR